MSYLDHLLPDGGTSWWKREDFTILDNHVMDIGDLHSTVTWKVTAYAYTIGAKPDKDFIKNSGEVVVVLLHSGHTYNHPTAQFKEMWFKVTPKDSNNHSKAQLPESGTGTVVGDDTKYVIDYTQTLPMYLNHGNKTYNFDAQYRRTFEFTASKQTGSSDSNALQFAITKDKDSKGKFPDDHEVIGLSVLTVKEPKSFTLTFTFHVDLGPLGSPDTVTKDHTIELDFKV